jgi:chromatin remodeling complex protein RSC6
MCDLNLKNIMGGKDTVTMFNMNRYITDHLLEKLDRSAYQHDDDDGEGGGDDDTAGGGD